MFTFTPLLGANSLSPASQSLLELDGGVQVLVDVGWDESFNVDALKALEKQIPTVSLILLTHATVSHIGAYAHCCKHVPLFSRIPVYATTPVISLGRTLLQDIYASSPLASTVIPESSLTESAYVFSSSLSRESPNILLQPPTLDEIAGYFSLIHPLKYSQPHQPLSSPFSPPLNGLTITAYSAGHTLGGTIWHIQLGLESIVYAVDWNQAREHVLPGAAWLGGSGARGAEVIEQLRRPTAMICSSRGTQRVSLPPRKKRDELLLSSIRNAIAHGGVVLIPSDSSARSLELAYLLEDAWEREMATSSDPKCLRNAKLYLASRTCGITMRYARSMLEWMEEGIVRDFESANGTLGAQNTHVPSKSSRPHHSDLMAKDAGKNDTKVPNAPFDFRHLRLLERPVQLARVFGATGARVIIASDTSIEWGLSRDTFRRLAGDSRNLIILTERCWRRKESLGRALYDLWEEQKVSSGMDFDSELENAWIAEGRGSELSLNVVKTLKLDENEVQLYQQFLARKRQLMNTMQADSGAAPETSADVSDDQSSTTSTSSDDSDAEHQGRALNAAATVAHTRHRLGLSDAELGVNILLRRKGVHDFDVRGKKGREKMFPFIAKRRRADEFGDLIRPEDYLRAEEREEMDGGQTRDSLSKKESTLGQKRRWDGVGTGNGINARSGSSKTDKRQKSTHMKDTYMSDASREGADKDIGSDVSEDSDEGGVLAGTERPWKVSFSTEKLRLMCKVTFVDFSGLHDKRSLQMLVPLIRPRKLILIGGEEAETQSLASNCRTVFGLSGNESLESVVDIFTPNVGSTVDASVDTNAWAVKLSQSLMRRVQWQQVRGRGVVAITGCLGPGTGTGKATTSGRSPSNKKLKTNVAKDQGEISFVMENGDKNAMPILDLVPMNMAGATRVVAQPLHVGDLRLADLRKILQASGFTAEFMGEGTLLVNGTVAVRKSGIGKIEVEGSVAQGAAAMPQAEGAFYAIRRKIYEGLAIVAGGF